MLNHPVTVGLRMMGTVYRLYLPILLIASNLKSRC